MAIKPEDQIFQCLSTNGDGTGTVNATGDYSSAATDFYIVPPDGYEYYISRMIVFIEDAANMSSDEYGNLNSALTNGISIVVKDRAGTEIEDLTGGQPITTNAQWAQHCYDAQNISYGAGNDFVNVRWTFAKSGAPVFLHNGRYLAATLNDNFTGLASHTFIVQGYRTQRGN